MDLLLLVLTAGCAATLVSDSAALRQARRPAWSLKANPEDLVVAVSPAGKTLRVAGSAGVIVGAGVDAVVNSRYRKAVASVLEGYDVFGLIESRIETELGTAMPLPLTQVPPLRLTAGYESTAAAQRARHLSLAREGVDVLLDLEVSSGVYGPDARVATKLVCDAAALPHRKRIARATILAVDGDLLAGDELGDPTRRMRIELDNPRFSVEQAAVDDLTADNGRRLREALSRSAEAVSRALVCALGLREDPVSMYALGRSFLSQKDIEQALACFGKAVEADPSFLEARNALSVASARNGDVGAALDMACTLTKEVPDYGPPWYNAAWWYAVEMEDPERAAPFYSQARLLGLPASKKVEAALERIQEKSVGAEEGEQPAADADEQRSAAGE
jgi:tetratricopeptide (TPR) repeat protein